MLRLQKTITKSLLKIKVNSRLTIKMCAITAFTNNNVNTKFRKQCLVQYLKNCNLSKLKILTCKKFKCYECLPELSEISELELPELESRLRLWRDFEHEVSTEPTITKQLSKINKKTKKILKYRTVLSKSTPYPKTVFTGLIKTSVWFFSSILYIIKIIDT